MIVNPWKLSVRMGVLTANLNGWMARKQYSTDTRLRRAHLVRKMDQHGIQLAGIQETHFDTEAEISQQKYWPKRDYGMEATVASGRGSAPVLWRQAIWSATKSHRLEPRILIVTLRHQTEQQVRVVSAHMHHRPGVRERQWRRLQQHLQGQPDIPTLLLMDHNNILTPGVGSQFVRGEEVSGVQSARGAEVDALRTLAVVDVWELVHAWATAPPPPYTYGHMTQGPKRNLRRIDRVHVPEATTPSVAGAYTVLTRSDHRGVVMQLAPPTVEVGRPRPKFPQAMLADEVSMLRLQERIHSLTTDSALEWLREAQYITRGEGAAWARAQTSKGFSQLEAAVRASSPCHVVRSGWEYLEQQGLCRGSTGDAYCALASFLADERLEAMHQQSINKLRTELQTKEERVEDSRQRCRRVLQLMKEMKERRTAMRMRDSQGNYAQNRDQMASMLQKFWEGVMPDKAVTEAECTKYLESLPIPANVKRAAPMLFRPVSLSLVQEALRQMKPHSSPGLDGMQASVYQATCSVFSEKMVTIMEQLLAGAPIPEDWTATILKCIPKSISAETSHKKRPLALQNTKGKWVSAVMLLQIHDVLQAITPPSQKGFSAGGKWWSTPLRQCIFGGAIAAVWLW